MSARFLLTVTNVVTPRRWVYPAHECLTVDKYSGRHRIAHRRSYYPNLRVHQRTVNPSHRANRLQSSSGRHLLSLGPIMLNICHRVHRVVVDVDNYKDLETSWNFSPTCK